MTEYGLSHGQYLQARRINTHKPGATVRFIAEAIGADERAVRAAIGYKREQPATPKPPRAKKSFTRLRPGLKVSGYSPCGHRKAAGLAELATFRPPSFAIVRAIRSVVRMLVVFSFVRAFV